MFDLDWQPSTVIDAPLIQLARGEARNATTDPTSSARPKRPNGSSRLTKSAMTSGSACWRRCQDPPGNRIEPGATLLTRMLSRRKLLRQRLAEADLGGLHRVVGHAAARLAAPDRRDHDDRPAAARAHVRHGLARGANRGEQRLVERTLPVGVGGPEQIASRGPPHVVHQDVDPAERGHGLPDDRLDALARRHIRRDPQNASGRRRLGLDLCDRLRQPLRAPRAQAHVAPFRRQRLGARQAQARGSSR